MESWPAVSQFRKGVEAPQLVTSLQGKGMGGLCSWRLLLISRSHSCDDIRESGGGSQLQTAALESEVNCNMIQNGVYLDCVCPAAEEG